MKPFNIIAICVFVLTFVLFQVFGIWISGGVGFQSIIWLHLGITLAVLPTAGLVLTREFGGWRQLPWSAINALFFTVSLTLVCTIPLFNLLIVLVFFIQLNKDSFSRTGLN